MTPWRSLPDAPSLAEHTLAELLDGGQAFRWNRIGDAFEGRWAGQVARLRLNAGILEYSAPKGSHPLPALRRYLALDTDFDGIVDALPWRCDPVLRRAIEAFPGLCLLRQPFQETLFAFLCSSTKQIPQIKAICEAVAADLGDPLPDGSHALPTWPQLAEAGEARLRAARLGYRARYIHQTALVLAERPGWFAEVAAEPTAVARERLLQLPGVGRKIADCVLLFGLARLEAFPVDTWVQKILVRAYGLEGWRPEQLRQFARIHFGPAAGLAQQYLFAAARAGVIAA